MIVNCGNCQQEYVVYEEDLKSITSRFKCKKCDEFIIVTKPEPETAIDEDVNDASDSAGEIDSILNDINDIDQQQGNDDHWLDINEQLDTGPHSVTDGEEKDVQDDHFLQERAVGGPYDTKKPGRGVTIRTYLSMTFLAGYLFTSAVIVVLYWLYVPKLVNEQIDERTAAISKMFSGSVEQYMMVRNYLKINQEAERISQIPGVAYASVINNNGTVIAGVFSQPSLFHSTILEAAKNSGFPKELATKNVLGQNETEKSLEFFFAGQRVYDVAASLRGAEGEVHVGLFISDIQLSVKKSFIPLLISISVLFVMGMISFSLLARFVSNPVQELTEMANRISQGEIDERVDTMGPREIRELSQSLDRMRISVRAALKRLQG